MPDFGNTTLLSRIRTGGIGAARDRTDRSRITTPQIMPTVSSGTPSDVSGAFERALAELSGSTDAAQKLYAQGRNQATSQAAIAAMNSGTSNFFNAGGFGLAYDQANRPGFEVGLAAQRANVLQNLGQTAAGIYGTNVGAQTSRYGTDVGAGIAAQGNVLQFRSNMANQALQKYIADLNASLSSNVGSTSASTLNAPSV